MVTPVQKIPALLGFGQYKPQVYKPKNKKVVQRKVPALLRKDFPVYTKTST